MKLRDNGQPGVAYRRYIMDLAAYCRQQVFGGEYDQRFHFSKTPHPDDTAFDQIRMTVFIDVAYLYMNISVYPCVYESYRRKDYKKIGNNMLHEACHLLTEPLKQLLKVHPSPDAVREVNERQTQRTANTVFALLPPRWYTPEALAKWRKRK